MATRRANGEGGVYKTGNGFWRAQIMINGKRLSHTSRSQWNCQEWLRRIIENHAAGLSLNGANLTLEEFMKYWLVCVKTSIRPTTHYQYRMTCEQYILPYLGHMLLTQIQPQVIQNLYNDRINDGLGYRTVQMIHSVLHSALEMAVRFEYIRRNPATSTIQPRVEKKEYPVYDRVQISTFLSEAMKDKNGMLYHLALVTGMRQSELLGLKWFDLDWQKKTLSVQRQLRRNGTPPNCFAPLKTMQGRRVLLLGETTLNCLRRHQQQQIIMQDAAGEGWQNNDLIFPTPGGTPKNHANLFREFKDYLRRTNLPEIRFHDLRHLNASILLTQGIPPLIVSKRLGHSNMTMTMELYGHLIPGYQNLAVETLENIIA